MNIIHAESDMDSNCVWAKTNEGKIVMPLKKHMLMGCINDPN